MPIPACKLEQYIPGESYSCVSNAAFTPALAGAAEGALAMLKLGGEKPGGQTAQFSLDAALASEAYAIEIGEGGVFVRAGGQAAAVYAAATLAQISAEHGGTLPRCSIEDAPRFGWRGLLFDACRHFFPIKTLYSLVDLMAYYKYNRLHLHLSDDQGFRFESERFPLLNRIGSSRASTLKKRGGVTAQDGAVHSGYYRKGELVALVAYAKARGIEIVPELDIPGHALAILAAYPALACFDEPVSVATYFGVRDYSKKIFCTGKEETVSFLCSLLEEILEVFPFEYIHLGGDEAVKSEWKRCPRCQQTMKEQGLKDERALQGYLLNRLSRFLNERGRRAIIWNDGLCDHLDSNITTQFWRPFLFEGAKRTVRRVNAGGAAIMSHFLHVYYDYPYALTPLEKTYDYNPVLRGIRKQAENQVLGVECAIWTEWIDSPEKLFFNTLPRLAATAETGWSARAKKPYADFLRRLKPHYALYDHLRLAYAKCAEKAQPLLKRILAIATFLRSDTHAELKQLTTKRRNKAKSEGKCSE